MKPLVTISIPTYNQERYIARAIESALEQNYPRIEVVVADDCSTDRTYEIARGRSDPRLKVVRNERNIGRVANYRRCLYERASGEWFVNLDGDDQYLDSGWIAAAVDQLAQEPEAVMYAAGSACLHEADGAMEWAPMEFEGERLVLQGADYVLRYPHLGATQHFSVLYNRPLALQTDFYSLDSLGADTDSLLRLALKGKVVIEKKWVGAWTHHDHNASYTLDDATVEKEVAMLRRVAAALAGHVAPAEAERWLDRLVREKRRLALILMLSKLPVREAWPLLARRARFDVRTAKEAAKLLLRTSGLR
jgi:glycosyltransferase involved in cell wall biosynthesis